DLLASPSRYRIRQGPAEIAKEGERLRRSPFVAHEQERRHRGQQRDGERCRKRDLVRLDGETVTQRTIADLVVVLQKIDESERRQRARWFSATVAFAVTGNLALIGKARRQSAGNVTLRVACVVLIVSRVLSGQQKVPSVMVVVIPLRTVFSFWGISLRIEQACAVIIVLQDEMDHSSGGGGEMADHATEV